MNDIQNLIKQSLKVIQYKLIIKVDYLLLVDYLFS